jgi:PAS domain S-box-containing protein
VPTHWTTVVLRSGFAVVAVAVAIGGGLVARSLGVRNLESPLCLIAVALTVWNAGLVPGLLAVLLAGVSFGYFFVEPLYSMQIEPAEQPLLVVFILFGLIVAAFAQRRRRIEDELRDVRVDLEREVAERTQQASLLDLTHDTIFVRDMQDVITYWNRGAEELLGWTAEQAVGKRANELFGTVFPVPPDEIRAELLRTDRWEGELDKTRADGTQVTVASRWSLRRNARQEPAAILETNNDVTERRRREQQVQTLNRDLATRTMELQATNKELEAFAYSISHDLRAPLRHVAGYAEMLQRNAWERLDEKSRRYMTVIVEAAKRMGNLIDDLLAFSRIGRAETRMSRVGLDALVKEVVDEVRPEAEGRELAWTVDPLPEVYADRAMLRLVLVNLVSNAVKFTRTRPSGAITIGSTADGDGKSVVFVRDNGVGFDMQYADKLFGVFQRLHSAEAFEGTGIGLATVQRIVHRHGGRAWAEGAVDQGATFYVSFPKA